MDNKNFNDSINYPAARLQGGPSGKFVLRQDTPQQSCRVFDRKIRLRKSLGQHILVDKQILERIIERAKLTASDCVLEIGAGSGELTTALAEKSGRVVSVEMDSRFTPLLEKLKERFSNLEIIRADILKLDLGGIFSASSRKWKIVANIPYYLTTPLISTLLEKHNRYIDYMILMVQREVAKRLTAAPGGKDYGAITLMVEYFSESKILFKVPATSFKPKPKVESAVIMMKARSNPPVEADEKILFRLVRASFNQRRKKIKNALLGFSSSIDFEGWNQIFKISKIDPSRRGETLSLQEFAVLASAVSSVINP
ncbi:MAG: 16S rRNA (adenine(1518)-N(6)/adenine(1519)-N(6))-dimethyltransferase RsmA [Firmicutes bacterium]|nr:16S rRNA (adenine(1518)-N(6)/adenine(1519)-N(6))-dimethyltransferase RsmA [Bacillota bacterium]